MKKNFTLLIAAAVMLLAMVVQPMKAVGQTRTGITWTASQQGYSNQQAITSVEFDDNVSAIFDKGTNSNAPKYYTSGNAIRCYGGNYFTISTSSGNLTNITITFGSSDGSNAITTDGGTYENGTWTGSATSVKFTIGGTTGNRRIAGFNITYSTGGTQTVATPTFSPAAGAYTSAQNVTISTTTENATIYYTLDGTDPTTSSTEYTGAISVSSNTTIKAMATATGYDNSSIATANYYILNHAGTEADPYSVADARAAIDANTGVTGVYATGKVSAIPTAYNSTYSNITFNMVDESGDEVFLQAYRCGGDEAANVMVGDVAVVYGNLTKYNTTYEFAQGCEVVSLTHTATTHSLTYSVTPQDGGSVTVGTYSASPATVTEGAEVEITATPNTGYTFESWTVSGDGSSVADATAASTTFTMGTEDATLTANFNEVNTYTVTYHANVTGTTDIQNSYSEGEDVTIANNTFSNPGYAFTKWNTNENGTGTDYMPGDVIQSIAANYDLWAQWEESSQATATLNIQSYAEAHSWVNATKYETATVDVVTFTATGGSNTGKYYTSGYEWRYYQGESATITISVSDGYHLKSITPTYNVNNGGVLLNGSTTIQSGSIVEVSGTSVTFSVGNSGSATNGQVKFTNIDVIYESDGGTPAPSIVVDNEPELAYDVTNGTFTFSLNNPVDGGQFSVNTENKWITGVEDPEILPTGSYQVAFTTSTNTAAAERQGVITITYDYPDNTTPSGNATVIKDVTVTQAGNPNIVNNISDINEVGANYHVRGTVVATNARGFIIGDGTGYVYTYLNAAPTQSVGDIVSISGTTGQYGHIIQFTNSATITEATESGYDGGPEYTVITEVPDYSEGYHISNYFQFEGTLTKTANGNYNNYNVEVGESTIRMSYPTDDQITELEALLNKTVRVHGFFAGISGNGDSAVFTTMMESIEEITPTTPAITIDPTMASLPFEGGSATFTMTCNNLSANPDLDVLYFDATGENTADYDWLDTYIDDNNVITEAAANDGTARTGYFKVYDSTDDVYSDLVTVNQAAAPSVAELPFAFDGGRADVATTDGLSQENLGTDYNSSPKLKFEKGNKDNDGLYSTLVLQFNERPGTLTFDIKGNSFSGSTFKVQTSEDGTVYTDLETYTELGNKQSETFDNLGKNVRYIKWIYTQKVEGNVALGNIALTEYVEPVVTPSITLSPSAIYEVPATGDTGELDVLCENMGDDPTLVVILCDANGDQVDYDWITADFNQDFTKIIGVVEANETTEPRTAYLKVIGNTPTQASVTSNIVSITQLGQQVPPTSNTYALFSGDLVEGDYLIVYGDGAMNTTVSGNRLQYAEVTPESDVITTDNTAIVWHIAPNGEYWTIYNEADAVYAASTGTKNQATTSSTVDDKALWTVSGDETYEFVNKNNAANSVNANLRRNGTYGFACYATGTGGALSLYKKADGPATPSITAANVEIAYDATSGEIAYTINNPVEGGHFDAVPLSGGDYFTIGQVSQETQGVVPFTCPANTGEEAKTATVQLKYTYDNTTITKEVTITQAAAPSVLTTIPAIFEAATDTETAVNVTFNNWAVSGVSSNGKNVFVTDNEGNGFVIYSSSDMSATYSAGKVLNGTAVPCSLKLYNGFAELLNVDAQDLTITDGGTITEANIPMANLAGVNTGALVHYDNLTCSVTNNKYYLSDGTTTIQVYTSIYNFGTIDNGKTYNITGIYQQFNDTKEVLPRSADDIEEVSGTTPVINAENVNIPWDAEGGVISYEVVNPVEGGQITTYPQQGGDRFTVTEIGENTITFTCPQNTDEEELTAIFDIIYTYNRAQVVKTVTITQAAYSVDYAVLPFVWEGGASADFLALNGVTANGLGSDYAATHNPYLIKFDGDGDYIQIKTDSQPGIVTIGVKMIGGNTTSYITVQGSTDGETFDEGEELTISGATNTELTLTSTRTFGADVRYVRLLFTKGSNVGVGPITIEKHSSEPYITVATNEINVTAAGEDDFIGLTYGNIEITQASDFGVQFYDIAGDEIETPDWIDAEVTTQTGEEGYFVYYVIGENTGNARIAYFKVFAEGDADFVYSNLVTVNQAAPSGPAEYVLVTDASQIVSGMHYIITNGTDGNIKAMGVQNSNNRAATDVTASNGGIDDIAEAYIFVINGTEDHYTIYDKEYPGYLYAASKGSNYLKTRAENSDGNSEWTITIDSEGKASIVANGENTRNTMRYNSGSTIFSCYDATNNQQDIYLFVKDDDANLEYYGCDLTVTNLVIEAGESITIGAGSTMTVTGTISNDDNPDNLVIADGGQFIYDGTNDFYATQQKDITSWNSNAKGVSGWYLIASPAETMQTDPIAVGNYDLFAYDEPQAYWMSSTGTMAPFDEIVRGQGYLYANESDMILNFAGKMIATNSNISVHLSSTPTQNDAVRGFNLVGNPFTRELGLGDMKIGDTEITNYYISEGGEELVPQTISSNPIKPGRGFMIQTDTEGDLVFNPSSKGNTSTHGYISISAGGDNAFINIANGNTLRKMSIANTTKVYVMNGDKDYAAARVEELAGTMPVNFKAVEAGIYTITVEAKDVETHTMYLVDNFTGDVIDLMLESSYTFNATETDSEARFTLVFDFNSLDEIYENSVFAYQSGSDIYVNGEGTLQVFDMMGRMVMNTKVNGVQSVAMPQGVYIFRMNDNIQKIVVR